MLLIGLLSLCQICFLPGYLCLRAFRVPVRGLLQGAIYSFALSLIANHTLVYALFSAGLYSAPVVYEIFALEWLALFYLMRRDRFRVSVTLPSEETLARYRALWRDHPVSGRLIAIPAFAALMAAAALCYYYFGSVFLLNDDVVSWDRWAMEWARNRLSGTGLYPQLLPANWSITYVMLGTTEVKMFAKAIMPLFTLATLLLFLDLFHKTGRLTWLVGLSCYAFLLCFFFQPVFLASGYAEIASAFFAFLTLHAFLRSRSQAGNSGDSQSMPILVAVFASGTLLTKQGGVYVFALALGWLVVDFARRIDKISWRVPVIALALILLVNWRWVVTEWRVMHGQTLTNLAYLTKDIHEGRTYPQRWQSAWHTLLRGRCPECTTLAWVTAGGVLLAVFDPHARWVFLLLFAPFYVLWAFLFSYENRTLAMDLPFAADCFACGAAAAGGFCLRAIRFAISRLPRPAASVTQAASGGSGKAAKRAIKKAQTGKQSSKLRSRRPVHDRLRWLLAGLATLIFGWRVVGNPLSGWVRSSEWLLDMLAVWKWPMVAGFGLAILAPLAADRLSALRLRVPTLVLLLASAGAIGAVQTTIWPSGALLRDQLEKRKEAGLASLNRRLYEHAQRQPLGGKILTHYFFLEFLPELDRHQRYLDLPQPATPEFLEDVLADPEVCCLLGRDGVFPPQLRVWMRQRGFRSVFEEQGYQFFELPADRASPAVRILGGRV